MRTVLLVGIQYSMGHSLKWSYLERARNHLRAGRRLHDQILMSIEPLYNMSKDMKPDSVPTFLYDQVTSPPFYLEYNSEILNNRLELGLISREEILKLPKSSLLGYHPFYLSDEIKRLLETIPLSSEVEIWGGEYSKSVDLIYKLLVHYGYSVYAVKHLCYDINVKQGQLNVFETKPTKIVPKKSLDSEGCLKMTTVPLPLPLAELNRSH